MMKESKQRYNSARRLPIVFCLDVSPSMGWKTAGRRSSIELLTAAVNSFIAELKQDTTTCAAAEVAFITFSSDVLLNTDFVCVADIGPQKFVALKKGGTYISKAVLCAIDKIENRRQELVNAEINYFAPFLILVTDGDPDEIDKAVPSYNEALAAVKKHCDSHVGASEIIVPFIIGVGDHVDSRTLTSYAEGFTKGYFPIKGDSINAKFSKVFKLIGNSTNKSIHLNGTTREKLSAIQLEMNDVIIDLESISGT